MCVKKCIRERNEGGERGEKESDKVGEKRERGK